MTRAPEAGFTLIETLVALAILAMSAMALLSATEAHIRTIAALETRAAAQWVAENHLAELSVGAKPDADAAPMLGIALSVTTHAARPVTPILNRSIWWHPIAQTESFTPD